MILARLYVKIMFHVKQSNSWEIKNESRRDVGNSRLVFMGNVAETCSQGQLTPLNPTRQ